MKKGEILDTCKLLSKEYFNLYIESVNGDFGVLDDDVIVIGFYEDVDKKEYKMIFELPKLPDVYCEIIHDIDTRRLHSSIFKKVNYI